MYMTATKFRQTLFHTLDTAINGESVTVEYKGRKLRVVAELPGTKLSRAIVPEGLMAGNEDEFDRSIRRAKAETLAELEAKWEQDARELRAELDADSVS
jgi:hypothetical protein